MPAPECVHSSDCCLDLAEGIQPQKLEKGDAGFSQVRFRLKSWIVSLVVHLLAVLILGLITYSESASTALTLLFEFQANSSLPSESNMRLLPLTVTEIESSNESESEVMVGLVNNTSDNVFDGNLLDNDSIQFPGSLSKPPELVDVNQLARVLNSTLGSYSSLTRALDGRKTEQKSAMLLKYGGSVESEAAVERALTWLVDHQASDGGWTFGHDQVCSGQCDQPGRMVASRNGATALALLPFLGAGYTHVEGKYKEVVNRGIDFLLDRQLRVSGKSPAGSWHEDGGTMYSHCLASIAICEAYLMTGDSRLRAPAQLSMNYLVLTQHKPGGGWRYQPGQPGDTSVVGWALMALKSGKMGRLDVPDSTLAGVNRFLNSVETPMQSTFGYVDQNLAMDGGRPTTAIGLLCRMYQGAEQTDPKINRGAKMLGDIGPNLGNLYYTYYATQVIRHLEGPSWEQWNQSLRDPLIAQQVKIGHASGSWQPNGIPEMGGRMGGRLYSTCMATMILEVYYRHMPLYSSQAIDDDFKL